MMERKREREREREKMELGMGRSDGRTNGWEGKGYWKESRLIDPSLEGKKTIFH